MDWREAYVKVNKFEFVTKGTYIHEPTVVDLYKAALPVIEKQLGDKKYEI